MNVSNIKYFCTTNGDGFRTAVFVSGCNLHCKGCFNTKAWDFNFGMELTDEVINDKILKSIEPEYIEGLSILGGEPMDVKNQEGVASIIRAFRDKFEECKSIWMWSGYYYENMPKTEFTEYILKNLDFLVDGPFDIDQQDINLIFKGSKNQRIIDIKATKMNGGKLILKEA